MSMLYNIHTPNKTFAIQHKGASMISPGVTPLRFREDSRRKRRELIFPDGEEYSDLVSRIASKASLSKDDVTALKEGKDGAGLVYEFEGGRWSLEDGESSFLVRASMRRL